MKTNFWTLLIKTIINQNDREIYMSLALLGQGKKIELRKKSLEQIAESIHL